MRRESIAVTRVLSVTTLKAYTIVHANQDILEMALTAQVTIYRSNNPDSKKPYSHMKKLGMNSQTMWLE